MPVLIFRLLIFSLRSKYRLYENGKKEYEEIYVLGYILNE